MRYVLLCLSFSFLACKTDPAVIPDSTVDTGGDADAVENDTAEDVDTTVEDDTQADTADTDTTDTDVENDTQADTADTTAEDVENDTQADTADTTEAPACTTAEDCQNCTWGRPVESEADCYCPLCPTHPLSRAQCEANQAGWNTHCSTTWAENNPCPIPRCLMVAPPVCSDVGECAANPNSCFATSDCTMCRFAEAPKSAADCACPMCPSPTSVTQCETIESAVFEHCGDFDFESCLAPPCARPLELTCTFSGVCGYDEPEF